LYLELAGPIDTDCFELQLAALCEAYFNPADANVGYFHLFSHGLSQQKHINTLPQNYQSRLTGQLKYKH
jgi:hypothetical protein